MEINRIKREIKQDIKKANNVYVIGHKDIDLDAFGAILGICLIVKKLGKRSFIIMDDKVLEPGVKKALDNLNNNLNILKTKELQDKNLSSSLLIIVDTNKKHLISCNEYLEKFGKVVILDHHDIDKNTIETGEKYIYNNISSACEMVTELLNSFKVQLNKDIATIILSGIVLDTNNFIIRADKKTFRNAYYLLSRGASTIEVQYLLKQDLKKFINRQKMLTNVKIINEKIAIAKGVKDEIYKKEDLAKIAETLLLFNNIETSFVIGNLSKDMVGISGRTLGKTNIGNIMKKFNGGGNSNQGASKIENSNIKEVEKKLIDILK